MSAISIRLPGSSRSGFLPFRTLADGGYPLRRSDAFLRFFTA